jgi:hypothetical protein
MFHLKLLINFLSLSIVVSNWLACPGHDLPARCFHKLEESSACSTWFLLACYACWRRGSAHHVLPSTTSEQAPLLPELWLRRSLDLQPGRACATRSSVCLAVLCVHAPMRLRLPRSPPHTSCLCPWAHRLGSRTWHHGLHTHTYGRDMFSRAWYISLTGLMMTSLWWRWHNREAAMRRHWLVLVPRCVTMPMLKSRASQCWRPRARWQMPETPKSPMFGVGN